MYCYMKWCSRKDIRIIITIFIQVCIISVSLPHSNYGGYFDELPIEAGRSESLFWSGTQELVEMVACMCPTGANVISSANTPSSQIINEIGNVYWCGTTSNSSSGECPHYHNTET